MSVNKVILLGNVGQDPRVKYFDAGSAVATFSLATTERGYTLANGTQIPDRTEWHNIVASNRLAEIEINMCTKVTNCTWKERSGHALIPTRQVLRAMSPKFMWIIWKCCLRKALIRELLLLHNSLPPASRSKCNSNHNRRSNRKPSLYKIIRQMTCRSSNVIVCQ